MQRTLLLTGTLPFVLLVSAALTAPLAALLLWLYRRAVVRSMARAAGAVPPLAEVATAAARAPLAVRAIDAAVETPPSEAYRRGRRSLHRLALVEVLAGLAYGAVFTAVWMLWVTPDGFIPTRALWLLSSYTWPVVVVLGLTAVTSRGGRLAIVAAYALVVAAVAGYVLARNPTLGVQHLITFWLTTNGPATALVLAFLARRVRAVGPLVLAFVTVGVVGAVLLVQLAGIDEGVLRGIADVGFAAGLGATGVFVALHAVGFALFAVLGWWVLRRVARRYQRKLLSDQTIVVHAVVLVFAVAQSIPLVFTAWPLIATGVIAWAAWVAVTRVGIARLVRPAGPADGPTLLLLRVFALGRRSQRLFDALATRWLRTGSITLIAGPDLVTSTVEPHEFLDFVAGKLSRRFVRGGPDLERRLAELDTAPDRDGRFRTGEFFCHADTWQETMRRLARRSDVVLMDLRGFRPGNAGCLYEIGQLLAAVSLARTVFVIDDTTDRPFLHATLERLWNEAPADSPNLRLADPTVRVFVAERASAGEVDGLLRLLLAAPARDLAGAEASGARAIA